MARTYRVGNRKNIKEINRGFSTGYNGRRFVKHGTDNKKNISQRKIRFLVRVLNNLIKEGE